jgi:hypothetical protein
MTWCCFTPCTRVAPNDANRLPWYQKRFFDTLDALRPEQGVGVLHHGLVAFPDWPLWSELVGIENRKQITPHFDQTVEVTSRTPLTRLRAACRRSGHSMTRPT